MSSPQVEKLVSTIPTEQLEAATRSLTLMDAMRLGAQVTTQAVGWGCGDTACALAAARIGAQAAGWCK